MHGPPLPYTHKEVVQGKTGLQVEPREGCSEPLLHAKGWIISGRINSSARRIRKQRPTKACFQRRHNHEVEDAPDVYKTRTRHAGNGNLSQFCCVSARDYVRFLPIKQTWDNSLVVNFAHILDKVGKLEVFRTSALRVCSISLLDPRSSDPRQRLRTGTGRAFSRLG